MRADSRRSDFTPSTSLFRLSSENAGYDFMDMGAPIKTELCQCPECQLRRPALVKAKEVRNV